MPRTHYFEQPAISESGGSGHADTPVPETDLQARSSINRKPVPSRMNQTSSVDGKS